MFGDPLGGLLFGGETLDYFRLAIGPKNIDHPAKSGITFSRHESGSVFGHLANMRLRRAGSSRSSDNNYMTVSEPQALEGTVRAKRPRAAGPSPATQALRSDVVRRAASLGGTLRCAERRVALPTVMSISPTRLIDNPNMVQSRVDFKTALLP
jgi:hypothetical protein